MSTFATKVTRIRSIEPIENADAIELAVVGDYRSVVRKGDFRANQLAVYIPEAAVLPEWLIAKLGLTGKLAGRDKNRVKAVKLRGCLSQGLLYPLVVNAGVHYLVMKDREERDLLLKVNEGEDVKDLLKITKYEPEIPAHMSGDLYNAGTEVTVNFDIENFKAYPDVLAPGEEVVITEKVHGTFCGVGILPERDRDSKHYLNKFVVFSKGNGARGLCFTASERSLDNVYFRALIASDVFAKLAREEYNLEEPLFILGEVYGTGVQKGFAYGSNNEVKFRAFDVVEGYRGNQRYWNYGKFHFLVSALDIRYVPILYRGPYSKEKMLELTSGTESVSGSSQHIREGVVVKPVHERYHADLGRVILKSVSEEYLLRKGGTEYN